MEVDNSDEKMDSNQDSTEGECIVITHTWIMQRAWSENNALWYCKINTGTDSEKECAEEKKSDGGKSITVVFTASFEIEGIMHIN